MESRFDTFARILADDVSRRSALGRLGKGVVVLVTGGVAASCTEGSESPVAPEGMSPQMVPGGNRLRCRSDRDCRGSGQFCFQDYCTCPAGTQLCGISEACVPYCQSGEVLDAACTCVSQCGSGQAFCNGNCVSTSCPPGEDFDSTTCQCEEVSVCPPGEDDCSGTCVDLASDVDHCGVCGNVCSSVPNATRTCVGGSCGYICISGWGDCDGNPSTGCEVNLNTSVTHCGACGNTCPSRANATTTCTSGVCGFTCNSGWGDCDGDPHNGCETNLTTSLNHCGACGNVCPSVPNATRTCVGGTCGFTCNSGWANCDGIAATGCEANLMTDSQNCGACGNVCPQGQSCVNGVCQ